MFPRDHGTIISGFALEQVQTLYNPGLSSSYFLLKLVLSLLQLQCHHIHIHLHLF